jgi:hypothetical protein
MPFLKFKIQGMHTNYALFAAYDDNEYTKILFDTETDGFVVAHRKHGKFEFEGNKTIALMLIKLGYRIVLLENQQNVVSADATLDDELWEFKTVAKTMSMSNSVQRNIARGKRQAPNVLLFINQAYNTNDVAKGIHNAVKFDERELIGRIGVLFQNTTLRIFSKADILDESFREKFSGENNKGG